MKCDQRQFLKWLDEEVGITGANAEDILLGADNNIKNPDLKGCYPQEEEDDDNDDEENEEGDEDEQDLCSGPAAVIEDPEKKESKKMVKFITECPQGKASNEIFGIGEGNFDKLSDLEAPMTMVFQS